MNLTKIINSFKQLEKKEQKIKKRFSISKQQNYVYKNCLLEDQIEDLRVYGHTHKEIINKFRARHPISAHQIRSNINTNTKSRININVDKQNKSKVTFDGGITRCQTAHKSSNLKTPNNMLYIQYEQNKSESRIYDNDGQNDFQNQIIKINMPEKNGIIKTNSFMFGNSSSKENKLKKSQISRSICTSYYKTNTNNKRKDMFKNKSNNKQSNRIDINNQKQHVILNNNQIKKNLIKKYKKQFNLHFQKDLIDVKILNSDIKPEYKAKTLIIDTVQDKVSNKQTAFLFDGLKNDNIFTLTQTFNHKQQQKLFKNLFNQSEQLQMLKMLNKHIFDVYSTNYLAQSRKKLQRTRSWNECWKVIRDNISNQKQKLRFYIIEMSSLSVRQVCLYDLAQMNRLVEYLLKNQKMLHFCIIKQKQQAQQGRHISNQGIQISQKLVYQQFIISPRYTINNFEWHIYLFRYYLKRFLLMSEQYRTILSVNQQQRVFFSNYTTIPRKYYRFIHDLKQKSYVVIDRKINKCSGNLGDFLQQGFKQVEYRRMQWGCKGTKFVNQNIFNTNKKQIYFYICFFFIQNQYNFQHTLFTWFNMHRYLSKSKEIDFGCTLNIASLIYKNHLRLQ